MFEWSHFDVLKHRGTYWQTYTHIHIYLTGTDIHSETNVWACNDDRDKSAVPMRYIFSAPNILLLMTWIRKICTVPCVLFRMYVYVYLYVMSGWSETASDTGRRIHPRATILHWPVSSSPSDHLLSAVQPQQTSDHSQEDLQRERWGIGSLLTTVADKWKFFCSS